MRIGSNHLKSVLSVWLVIHLFAMVMAPNRENYLAAQLHPLLEVYLNPLELGSTWSFFAPEPGPPPVYIEWETLDKKQDTVATGRFPEKGSPYFLRERQNRRIAFGRFLVMSDTRTELVMVPYLCKTVPGTYSVRLWRVSDTIPSLDDIKSGKRVIGDEVGSEKNWVSHTFCEGRL